MSAAVGGRYILPFGVGLWSLATAVVPLAAPVLPVLLATRAVVGLGKQNRRVCWLLVW